jgi:2-oxoglutarate dehydrogenase complex dehydrogenase (E1) component-like enzyme
MTRKGLVGAAPVQHRWRRRGGGPAKGAPVSAESLNAAADDSLRATQLIRAYRVRGHLEARLDPLGLQVPKPHTDLDPETYGFGRRISTARSIWARSFPT